MADTLNPTSLASLGGPWHRWATVVEHYARRKDRSVLEPATYDAHYRNLIAAFKRLAESNDAATREYGRNLEMLARPWMSTRVLELSDRDILFDLSARCRKIDRELNGRRWTSVLRRWLQPALTVLLVAVLIAFTISVLGWAIQPLNDWFSDRWREIQLAFKEATAIQRVMAAGVILFPIAVFVAYRVRKI